MPAHLAIWSITGIALLGVIFRPFRLPEATWAVLGALVLVVCSLLPLPEAGAAALKGVDVYLFLTGMMLLSELARAEGLFDWLAEYAVHHAARSRERLFLLVYGVGTLVTVFMSNDATAVVLTPAVCAAARHARVPALPYLLACAFIANAASFVLPIANPANLVVYGRALPALLPWLRQFGAASIVAVLATYWILRATQRVDLAGALPESGRPRRLSPGGLIAAVAIALTAVLLLSASALGWALGLPTFVAGVMAWLLISALCRRRPWTVLGRISWGVLPLVAGLFVLVAGMESTGALHALGRWVTMHIVERPTATALTAGTAVALISNAVNNLPMGLLSGSIAASAHAPALTGALLIGVDVGPNLSVTGSLATLLWLVAIRREGQQVSAWHFLRVGSIVMPVSLLAALLTYLVLGAQRTAG